MKLYELPAYQNPRPKIYGLKPIHTGLHPESLCGNDCSGCVSPAEGGY